jgi:hypothetical protein
MTALSKRALCQPPIPINDQARLAELYRFEILDTLLKKPSTGSRR